MSFSKFVKFKNTKLTLGLNVYNLLDERNINSVHPLTGDPTNPGTFYLNDETLNIPANGGDYASDYYDRPWFFSSPREINFFVRFDFN